MRKITVLGECALDIVFPSEASSWPVSLQARPAGRLVNAAAIAADHGLQVSFVGEAARDRAGDLVVDFLKSHNVDTHCIDRFSDGGVTSSNFIFPAHEAGADDTFILNRRFPSGDRFNAPWPRIDADDIVVFGGFFAISDRTRSQLTEILSYASERQALIVYLPGFIRTEAPRITRLMPAILENLEYADIILTRSSDLRTLYSETDARKCFERNIKFYCRTMINIDSAEHQLTILHRDLSTNVELRSDASSLAAQSAALAALMQALMDGNVTLPSLTGLSETAIQRIAATIASVADVAS